MRLDVYCPVLRKRTKKAGAIASTACGLIPKPANVHPSAIAFSETMLSSRNSSTWSRVVGLLSDRVLDLDPIVTHRFPMSDFEEAMRLMDDRQGIVAKIVLEHET